MKAVFIRRYGGPEVLEYGDFPDPVVGAGEVLVKVAAASINPIDIMERSGLTKDFKPLSFPGVLGWDLVGHGRPRRAGRARFLSRRQGAGLGLPHLCRALRRQERSFSPKSRTAWTLSKRPRCRLSRPRATS